MIRKKEYFVARYERRHFYRDEIIKFQNIILCCSYCSFVFNYSKHLTTNSIVYGRVDCIPLNPASPSIKHGRSTLYWHRKKCVVEKCFVNYY